ncbi:XRE family transcriptional regulator, partial [Psychrobacter sp. TB20-MNA-CIBAN-0197]|uniref:ImmA/IrrE family metallo-endopeptidase n=1 Tax=Psychrobacter sp. TB20-MNA-CIBAN-0197 TaxID=3140453 RepID=UPI003324939C
MSKAELAEKLNITPRTLTNYLKGNTEPNLVDISRVLSFPIDFFKGSDLPIIDEHSVSFRSRSRMTKKVKAEALTYGITGFMLNDWFEEEFELVQSELPDLSHLSPEEAANSLRYDWGLGDKPIGNLIALLESKGIRIFSIFVKSEYIDAFSVWYDDTPFIFLNNQKTMERSRFDACHELGHLVRDIYSMKMSESFSKSLDEDLDSKVVERCADEFASAFLMPEVALMEYRHVNPTINNLIELKKVFGVSLVALAYRMHKLGFISEWVYTRVLCPEIAKYNYRKSEPYPMDRETSQVLNTITSELTSEGMSLDDIAK